MTPSMTSGSGYLKVEGSDRDFRVLGNRPANRIDWMPIESITLGQGEIKVTRAFDSSATQFTQVWDKGETLPTVRIELTGRIGNSPSETTYLKINLTRVTVAGVWVSGAQFSITLAANGIEYQQLGPQPKKPSGPKMRVQPLPHSGA